MAARVRPTIAPVFTFRIVEVNCAHTSRTLSSFIFIAILANQTTFDLIQIFRAAIASALFTFAIAIATMTDQIIGTQETFIIATGGLTTTQALTHTRVINVNPLRQSGIQIHQMLKTEIAIHMTSRKIHRNFLFANLYIVIAISAIQISSVAILVMEILLSQALQPVQTLTHQFIITIGILANINNNIAVDNKQATPLLAVPMTIGNVHLIAGIPQISHHDTRRVHHLYGALTIIATTLPTHAAIPTLIIITHSHIIQRVNRQAQLAGQLLLIKDTRMLQTELLKDFIPLLVLKSGENLTQNLYRFSSSIYTDTIHSELRTIPRVIS